MNYPETNCDQRMIFPEQRHDSGLHTGEAGGGLELLHAEQLGANSEANG